MTPMPDCPTANAILDRMRKVIAQYDEGACTVTECVFSVVTAYAGHPDAERVHIEHTALMAFYEESAIIPRRETE